MAHHTPIFISVESTKPNTLMRLRTITETFIRNEMNPHITVFTVPDHSDIIGAQFRRWEIMGYFHAPENDDGGVIPGYKVTPEACQLMRCAATWQAGNKVKHIHKGGRAIVAAGYLYGTLLHGTNHKQLDVYTCASMLRGLPLPHIVIVDAEDMNASEVNMIANIIETGNSVHLIRANPDTLYDDLLGKKDDLFGIVQKKKRLLELAI